jgi:hypothetical protein
LPARSRISRSAETTWAHRSPRSSKGCSQSPPSRAYSSPSRQNRNRCHTTSDSRPCHPA